MGHEPGRGAADDAEELGASLEAPSAAPPRGEALAAAALARLADALQVEVDPDDLDRALASASRSATDRPDPLDLVVRAAPACGLAVQVARWTLARAVLESAADAPVVATIPPQAADGRPGGLLVLAGAWGRRIRVARIALDQDDDSDSLAREASLSEALLQEGELARWLGVASSEEPLRVAVAEPACPIAACAAPKASRPSGAQPTGAPAGRLGPLRRAWRFARLDERDIRAVVLLAAASGLLGLAVPITVEGLVTSVAFGGLLQPLVVLAIALGACLSLAAALEMVRAWVIERVERRVLVRVSSDLAERLVRMGGEAFDRRYGPEMLNRFFEATTIQKAYAKLLTDGVLAALVAAIGLAVLAFYHPLLLAFDIALLLALAGIVFGLGHRGVQSSMVECKEKHRLAAWLDEMARKPEALRLGGAPAVAVERADALAQGYLRYRSLHWRVVARQLAASLALNVLASTLLLGLGGLLVLRGQLTLGQLVASWLIVSLVVSAVQKLTSQLEAVYDLGAAVDKLGELWDLPLAARGGEPPPRGDGPLALSLRSVGYRFDDGAKAIDGLELDLAPGDKLAVTGPSGSGKSTLCDLLVGLRAPTTGRALIDGVDRSLVDPAAAHATSVLVRAHAPCVSGTILENVRLARPAARLEEVVAALDAVGLTGRVAELPDGLHTELGAHARPLSAGEAVRVGVARALVANARLVVLDGALDLIEPEARGAIAAALCALPATVVLTTHDAAIARGLPRRLALEAPTRARAAAERELRARARSGDGHAA